jgi:hypothetical protein
MDTAPARLGASVGALDTIIPSVGTWQAHALCWTIWPVLRCTNHLNLTIRFALNLCELDEIEWI